MSTPGNAPSVNQHPRLNLAEIPEFVAEPQEWAPTTDRGDEPTVSLDQFWSATSDATDDESDTRWTTSEDDGEMIYFQVPSPHRWPWFVLMALALAGVAAGARHWAQVDRPMQSTNGDEHKTAARDLGDSVNPRSPTSPLVDQSSRTDDSPPREAEVADDSPPSAITTALRTDLERKISAAVGDPSAYQRRLDDYVAAFPDDSVSRAYRRVVEADVPIATAVAGWNQMLVRWATTDMRRITPAAAVEMLSEARSRLEVCADFPASSSVRQQRAFLDAVADRIDKQGRPIQAPLIELFRHPALSAEFVLQTVGGKRYYLTGRPVRKGDARIYEYLADETLARKSVELPNVDMDPKKSGVAPQGRLAQNALAILTQLDDGNWEQSFVDLVRAIHTEERLDPLLKALWLERVLAVACRGSQPLSTAFAPQLDALAQLRLSPKMDWVDPDMPGAPRLRVQAEDVVNDLPDSIRATTPDPAARLAPQSFPEAPYHVWSGRLTRDETGAWRCVAPQAAGLPAGPLFIIHRPEPTGPCQVRQIKISLSDESIGLSVDDSALLLEGRPVYSLIAPFKP